MSDDFISSTVRMFKHSESPEIFFYWAAISAISSVIRKNVFLDRGGLYKLYPNTYIFLVAASGMKKSTPINICKDLVTYVNNTRVISGRNSIQQILDDLGRAYSTPEGGMIKDAHGLLITSELAAFLIKDPDAMTILTDIYDTQNHEKEWKYSLKSGKSTLAHPCINLLGATNEEHFADAVPNSNIGGGFVARTFIIHSTERGTLNSLTRKQKVIDIECLRQHLKAISTIKGEFILDEDAIELYDQWYYTYHEINRSDPTGTINRIGDQILKVAMCIALSYGSNNMVITKDFIKEAIVRCLSTLPGIQQLLMGRGKSNLGSQTKIIIKELIEQPEHQISRKNLLSKFWGQFDSFDLDRMIDTLTQAGAIDTFKNGKETIYKLKKEALYAYLEYKKSIN